MSTGNGRVLRIYNIMRAGSRLIPIGVWSTRPVRWESSGLRTDGIRTCNMFHSQGGWVLDLPRRFQGDGRSVLRSSEMVGPELRLRRERRVHGSIYDCEVGSNICVEFLAS